MMQTSSTPPSKVIEAIQHKAYELWVKGGCREGVAEQNWIEAEQLVRSTQTADSVRPTPKSDPPSSPRAASSAPVAQKTSQKKNSMKRH
jgi:hypothetical protein